MPDYMVEVTKRREHTWCHMTRQARGACATPKYGPMTVAIKMVVIYSPKTLKDY